MSPEQERKLVLVIAAVQFVNIVDFMIVMPLGPDFAADLGIPLSQLGIIGGAYTASAAVSGLAAGFFLDRFDRRPALALALAGLAVGTAGGALATDLLGLVAARVIAGAFGGPATALAMSIVADAIPAERRGKALGSVMIAFSLASIVGVPAGLFLAQWGSWHTPFVVTGGLAVVSALGARLLLPPLRQHLEGGPREPLLLGVRHLLTKPTILASYAMTAISMMGMFIVIPNIAAFVQANLGYPREQLEWLYLAGGTVSFLAMRPIGRLVDRIGSFRVGSFGTIAFSVVLYAGFVREDLGIPVMLLFVFFFLFSGFRNVAYQTLTSKVPAPHERARFMSFQSTVQHVAGAAGAFLSS